LNQAENRAAFVKDEDAYCARYGLTLQQRDAVRHRNVLKMIEAVDWPRVARPRQLPHPDLQHRDRPPRAAEPAASASRGLTPALTP
jgi:hypothetical protein